MELKDYTSYDEIRAILGVSDDELEDSTLALLLYTQLLEMDLEDVYSGLPALYDTIKSKLTRTPQEQRLFNVTQVFSGYSVSKNLLTSATLFAPKKIDDGKASVERVADPFERLRDDIDTAYISIRNRLVNALAGVDVVVPVVASTFTYFANAPLSTDPVTGL